MSSAWSAFLDIFRPTCAGSRECGGGGSRHGQKASAIEDEAKRWAALGAEELEQQLADADRDNRRYQAMIYAAAPVDDPVACLTSLARAARLADLVGQSAYDLAIRLQEVMWASGRPAVWSVLTPDHAAELLPIIQHAQARFYSLTSHPKFAAAVAKAVDDFEAAVGVADNISMPASTRARTIGTFGTVPPRPQPWTTPRAQRTDTAIAALTTARIDARPLAAVARAAAGFTSVEAKGGVSIAMAAPAQPQPGAAVPVAVIAPASPTGALVI